MDPVLARQLEALTYSDPISVLKEIGPTYYAIARGERVNGADRKQCIEAFVIAALARCFELFSGRSGELTVNAQELRDADGHIRRVSGDRVQFMPVQVKEMPANPRIPIDPYEEFAKVKCYTGPELCLAYWVNRDVRIDVARLPVAEWRFGQFWIIGAEQDDTLALSGGKITDLQAGDLIDCHLQGTQGSIRRKRFQPLA